MKRWDIPKDWEWKKIGEVCDKINPTKNEIRDLQDETEITFVPMKAVSEEGTIVDPEIKLLGEVRNGYTYFKKKDVLFAKITPCMENGKTAVARGLINDIGFGSTEFHVLRVSSKIIPEFLHYYVRRKSFRKEAANSMTGTAGQKRVSKDFIENKEIPLPPIEEQRKIVEKLDKIFEKIDKAKEAQKEAKEISKKVMQAALHEIFSKNGKDWTWTKLNDILVKKPQYGLTAKSSKQRKEVRYIRISDIIDQGELKDDDSRFLDLDQEEFEKYKLAEKDILIARSGTVGKIYLHKTLKQKAVFASYLIRFKLNTEKIIPEFFFYYGLSPLYKRFIKDTSKVVAQPNISASEYCKLETPLPPLEEQRKIITYLDNVKKSMESLRTLQRKTEEDIEDLTPAILDKAFKGEL